jgi:hypothetical protein
LRGATNGRGEHEGGGARGFGELSGVTTRRRGVHRPTVTKVEGGGARVEEAMELARDRLRVLFEGRASRATVAEDAADEDPAGEEIADQRHPVGRDDRDRAACVAERRLDARAGEPVPIERQSGVPLQEDVGGEGNVRLEDELRAVEEAGGEAGRAKRHRRLPLEVREIPTVRDDGGPRELANARDAAGVIDVGVRHHDERDVTEGQPLARQGAGDLCLGPGEPGVHEDAAVRPHEEVGVDDAKR